jgi:TPR repeat protein
LQKLPLEIKGEISKSISKAIEWSERAAEHGYAKAHFNLGVCFADGIGVQQDYRKAVEWYEKAANKGYVSAQFNLGNLYSTGEGVPQDYDKAIYWWEKAADVLTPNCLC